MAAIRGCCAGSRPMIGVSDDDLDRERAASLVNEGGASAAAFESRVKSRKQAIAIGLSEARKAGAKVPRAPRRPRRTRKD